MILGIAPIAIGIGVFNETFPFGSVLKNITISNSYILLSKGSNYQGSITMVTNNLENIRIINNKLLGETTDDCISIRTFIKNLIISNNYGKTLYKNSYFVRLYKTEYLKSLENILINKNIANTKVSFSVTDSGIICKSFNISDNILQVDSTSEVLDYNRKFILLRGSQKQQIDNLKISNNIYLSDYDEKSSLIEVTPLAIVQNQQLNIPYMATKMQQEGVYIMTI